MWRKQDEPKAPGSAPDLVVSPAPELPRSLASQAIEPGAAAANVSRSIVVKGEISGQEDLFIDGEVHGSIRMNDGIVTVGPNGRVHADIDAREIIVRGTMKGALRGRDRVEIGRTGNATGDVLTKRISIEDGAQFCGKIEIVKEGEPRSSRAAVGRGGADALRPVHLGVKEPQP